VSEQPDVTSLELAMIAACALLASAVVTGLVRRVALTHDVIDVPNERSSHHTPTPRGGGVAIVVATTAALGVLAWVGAIPLALLLAMVGGGIAVAVVGLLDDRRPVSAGARFTVHLAAAAWALICLGGLGPLQVGDRIITFGWSGYALGALGIVWALNLFNFMDGIDGIAASEAIFVALAGALVNPLLAPSSGVAFAALVLAAACGGFLLWNWPPARIFLGDVGSGYLGYTIVVLAVAASRDNPAALWVWLILGGAFFVDATVTLVRRILRNERVHEAHRSHAYQWLARRWGSHGKATVAVLGVNLAWLLPCAAFAARHPGYAAASVIIALAPLAVLAVAVGSGRKEASAAGP
jgi:glycosyltransferase WbpL